MAHCIPCPFQKFVHAYKYEINGTPTIKIQKKKKVPILNQRVRNFHFFFFLFHLCMCCLL